MPYTRPSERELDGNHPIYSIGLTPELRLAGGQAEVTFGWVTGKPELIWQPAPYQNRIWFSRRDRIGPCRFLWKRCAQSRR